MNGDNLKNELKKITLDGDKCYEGKAKQKGGRRNWRCGNFNILICKVFTDKGAEQTLKRDKGVNPLIYERKKINSI